MPKISDAKRRAFRIPADYFTRRGWLGRGKLITTALAVALALLWWGLSWARSPRGDRTVSHGPVAAVHAAWENDCKVCHVPFQPIRGDGPLGSAHAVTVSNERCEVCHLGPVHHSNQTNPEPAQQSCAGCHRDHQGRDGDLRRGTVGDCTSCHADLKNHAKSSSRYAANINGFASDHPQFRLLAAKDLKDPGHLKFNHDVHMKPGQGTNFTLAKVEATDRGRYRLQGQKDDALATLNCASCHRLDAAGAYMLPTTYENDCRACHALTVEPGEGNGRTPLAVPHRLQPDKLRALLWGAYTERYLAKQPALAAALRDARPLPGKRPDADEAKARETIGKQVATAEAYLYQGKTTCLECHEVARKDAPKGEDGPAFEITPPAVKAVWFEHAAFKHAPHRAVDCKACHEKAWTSDTNKDVMLPDVENCKNCHAPAGRDANGAVGGVRHDCAECHTYHGGDSPSRNLGDPARDARVSEATLRAFLDGPGQPGAKSAP